MSATSTMVYTAPPPTNNTLDRAERIRLLRSSRKLGAVLGATPFVVDPETDLPSSHILALRGDARGGLHSHTSSQSSTSSSALGDSSEYVFVNASSNSRSAPYQVQAIFDNASPSSSRSSSPFPGAVTSRAAGGAGGGSPTSVTRKRKQDIGTGESGLVPLNLNLNFALPGPAAGTRKTRSGAADKDTDASASASAGAIVAAHPSQPLLLRLRSVPAIATSEGGSDSNVHHINTAVRGLPGDSESPSSPTSAKPLSPVASSFNINMGIDVIPPSPSSGDFGSVAPGSLSDREKRRKLAKLARTLGENIPPELVFRAAPASSSSTTATATASSSQGPSGAGPSAPHQPIKKLLRRTSSLTASKSLHPGPTPTSSSAAATVDPVAPFNYYQGQPSIPPLAVAAAPLPSPNLHSNSHQQSDAEPRLRRAQEKGQAQRHRPRSLTLGTASAFAFAAAAALTRGSSANVSVPAAGKAQPAPALSPLRRTTPTPTTTPPKSIARQRSPSPEFQVEDEDSDSERTPTLESTRLFPVPHPSEYFSRGSTSLDEPPFGPRSRSHLRPAPLTFSDHSRAQSYYASGGAMFNDPMPSPRPFIHVAAPPRADDVRASEDSVWSSASAETEANGNGNLKEWGRRKEREWSGEWNLKDMEDVARKLRGLKGR